MADQSNIPDPENLRHVLLKYGSCVTVGDVVAETGCLPEDAHKALNDMMAQYESTLRVNESGDLIYSFNPAMLRRDRRSWWQKHKNVIRHGCRTAIKILLTIVLITYFLAFYLHFLLFIIALFIILTIIAKSPFNILYFIVAPFVIIAGAFGKDAEDDPSRPKPFHACFYDFIFGPETVEKEPNLKKDAATLIRAKQGVITLNDWLIASGRTRKQCESDLARMTAEFDGNAIITDDGHILYTFRELSKTTENASKKHKIPHIWNKLQEMPEFTGNTFGKNSYVFAFTAFNIIMAWIFMPCSISELFTLEMWNALGSYEIQDIILGIVPFIINAFIFLIPILRLPFYFHKVAKAEKENAHRIALRSAFHKKPPKYRTKDEIKENYNDVFKYKHFNYFFSDFDACMNRIADDFRLDEKWSETGDPFYDFSSMIELQRDAANLRRRLDHEKLIVDRQKTVFSTDDEEQDDIEDLELTEEYSEFDHKIHIYATHSDRPSEAFIKTQPPEIQRAYYRELEEERKKNVVRRPPEIENDTYYDTGYDDNAQIRDHRDTKTKISGTPRPKLW